MTTTTKTARAEAIAKCANIIGKYCNVDPQKMFTGSQTKSVAVREARALLICHLYREGMSFLAIGRLFRRSEDHVRRAQFHGIKRLVEDDHKMLESLPSIPNTLNISNV